MNRREMLAGAAAVAVGAALPANPEELEPTHLGDFIGENAGAIHCHYDFGRMSRLGVPIEPECEARLETPLTPRLVPLKQPKSSGTTRS